MAHKSAITGDILELKLQRKRVLPTSLEHYLRRIKARGLRSKSLKRDDCWIFLHPMVGLRHEVVAHVPSESSHSILGP